MIDMKKIYILIFLTGLSFFTYAQSYEVLNYNFNGTPNYGINIRTNLPFANYSQMVSLKIEGYSYGQAATISLNLVWYIYDNSFYNYTMSTSGGYAPEISLTNNNGFVNIFINDRSYFQRFKVTAFAQGIAEQASWFNNWSTADEPLQGTNAVTLPYQNSFKGITNYGNLYSLGNVGIGTTSPFSKLHVKDGTNTGTISLGNDLYPGLISSSASSGEFRIDNRSSFIGYISFYPNGQSSTLGLEAMRIVASGNIGIGTSAPSEKLSVNGKIRAKG